MGLTIYKTYQAFGGSSSYFSNTNFMLITGVMESDESDAQSVEYMRSMYKGCMNEGKLLY